MSKLTLDLSGLAGSQEQTVCDFRIALKSYGVRQDYSYRSTVNPSCGAKKYKNAIFAIFSRSSKSRWIADCL